jgi:hypothetical protein
MVNVHRALLLALAVGATMALPVAGGSAATSSSYRFVGGAPITYTSNSQFVVIWRFNKAAPRGSNGSLRTAANISGVGYTGTPPGDPNAGYGATTLSKSHNCYQQVIPAQGVLKNATIGANHTVTAYVWSNTVQAKSPLKKGNTTSASTATSMAKALGC